MIYDKELVIEKLRRWEKYLRSFRLPLWNEIPDLGLYMDQVISLLTQYLDYLPPEIKDKQVITASTINNYVRVKVMPEPRKKKYYRVHIAYLIMICTLKQSLNIATVQKLIPFGIPEEQVAFIYNAYAEKHRSTASYFIDEIRNAAAPLLTGEGNEQETINNLVSASAIAGGFATLLAEKLLLLEGNSQ